MVVTAARSVPASGSLNSWHQISSAARIGGRYRRCWASVPWAMSVGPTMASPTRLIAGGIPAAAASCGPDHPVRHRQAPAPVLDRPPQPGPPAGGQLPLPGLPPHHVLGVAHVGEHQRGDGPPGGRYGGACSASHPRASARNAASSADSSTTQDSTASQCGQRGLARVTVRPHEGHRGTTTAPRRIRATADHSIPPTATTRRTSSTVCTRPVCRVEVTITLRTVNRLADESSPYLQQHKDNPVDWYPWGDEAFERARTEDKPVLLSIGYAACHWCHVMAHESFEDEATAALMNELFVNVKVDREERPDVDAVYMEAVQAMTGSGGWPMTVFLTPDGRPFYGGTYFPNKPRHGMPAFEQVLRAVDEGWRDKRTEVGEQAARLTNALGRMSDLPVPTADAPLPDGAALLTRARDALARRFDTHWGGFGPAPKFPQPDTLELLLRAHARHPDDAEALAMVVTTLDAMASGGMYDHLGGGFARYSTDGRWLVPHFEKMLYDQALLVRAYLHAWQVTGEDRYLQVLTETIDYVRRDLRHPDGGFYSSEDADSEGHEGTFYVWTVDELRDAARRRRRRRHRLVGRQPARQLRGHEHPPPAGAGRPAPAARRSSGPAGSCSTPGSSGSGPASTTRC